MAKDEKAKTKTLSARVPTATAKAFRQRVMAEDTTVQAIINEWITAYLKTKRGA